MRVKQVAQVDAPIRMYLEYPAITVGELGRLLIAYQAALHGSWQASTFDLEPLARESSVLITSTSSPSSLELIADYAVNALLITSAVAGPLTQWPSLAKQSFLALVAGLQKHARDVDTGRLTIVGPVGTSLSVPVDALENEHVAKRVQTLWDAALQAAEVCSLSQGDNGEQIIAEIRRVR